MVLKDVIKIIPKQFCVKIVDEHGRTRHFGFTDSIDERFTFNKVDFIYPEISGIYAILHIDISTDIKEN